MLLAALRNKLARRVDGILGKLPFLAADYIPVVVYGLLLETDVDIVHVIGRRFLAQYMLPNLQGIHMSAIQLDGIREILT